MCSATAPGVNPYCSASTPAGAEAPKRSSPRLSPPVPVIAAGGGAVLDADNRRHLSSRGYVIYLQTSVDQQLRRIAHDRNRPLLQTSNPRQKLEELMSFRDPLYREVADWTIETDGCRVRDVVQNILRHIEETQSAFYPERHDKNASS